MPVRALPKVKKAQTGTAVQPTGFDASAFDDLYAQQTQQGLQSEQLNQVRSLVDLLMGAQQFLNPQVNDGGPGPGPVGDILTDQRARAQIQSQGHPASATYTLGLNPGGLFDTMSEFIGKFGVDAPSLEPGQRMVNRVPMGSIDDAIAIASQIAQSGYTPASATAPSGPFADAISALIAPYLSGDALSMPEGLPENEQLEIPEGFPEAMQTADAYMQLYNNLAQTVQNIINRPKQPDFGGNILGDFFGAVGKGAGDVASALDPSKLAEGFNKLRPGAGR